MLIIWLLKEEEDGSRVNSFELECILIEGMKFNKIAQFKKL